MYIVCYSIQFIQLFIYFHFAANRGRVNDLLARSFALFNLLVYLFTCQFVCLFACSLACVFIRSIMPVPLFVDPFVCAFCPMYIMLSFICNWCSYSSILILHSIHKQIVHAISVVRVLSISWLLYGACYAHRTRCGARSEIHKAAMDPAGSMAVTWADAAEYSSLSCMPYISKSFTRSRFAVS